VCRKMLRRKPTKIEIRQEDVEDIESARKAIKSVKDIEDGSMRKKSAREIAAERIGLELK